MSLRSYSPPFFSTIPGKWSLTLMLILGFSMSGFAQQYYHLIAASHKTFQAAENEANALEAKIGFKPLILFPDASTSYHRVSIYHSTNRQEVVNQKPELVRRSGKKAWILTLNGGLGGSRGSSTATATTERQPTMNAGAVSTKPGYHLIMGSYQNYQQATNAKAQLTQDGLEPYMMMPEKPGDPYRLAVYYTNVKKEIKRYSSMLKKRTGNGGWIYTQKPGKVSLIAGVPTQGSSPSDPTAARTGAPRGNQLNGNFHVIAGSYGKLDQAENFAEAMRLKGLAPVILYPEGKSKYYRVSVYRAASEEEAKSWSSTSSSNGLLKKPWVLKPY
ncbi:MAG: SPOR domain-containing protein [Bacteroidota bacterium]